MYMNVDTEGDLGTFMDSLDEDSNLFKTIENMDNELTEFFKMHTYEMSKYIERDLDYQDWPEFAKDMVASVSYGEVGFRGIKFKDIGWITYEDYLMNINAG